MLERDQQVSLRTLRLSCFSNAKNLTKAPAFKTSFVCLSSPVTILPKVLKQGIRMLIYGCSSNSISFGITPVFIIKSIRSLSPSERYDIAQAASVNTSDSDYVLRTWANIGIESLTNSNFGSGLPLQRLDSVQMPCFIVSFLFASDINFIRG